MITLLTTHIIIAVVTTVASVTGLAAAWRQSRATNSILVVMWGSFTAVAATGVALMVTSPKTIMHTCAMMSLYVIVTTAVQLYARRQQAVRVKA